MAQPIILLRTPLKYTFKVTLRRKKFDDKLVILFFIFLLMGGNFVLPNIKNWTSLLMSLIYVDLLRPSWSAEFLTLPQEKGPHC